MSEDAQFFKKENLELSKDLARTERVEMSRNLTLGIVSLSAWTWSVGNVIGKS